MLEKNPIQIEWDFFYGFLIIYLKIKSYIMKKDYLFIIVLGLFINISIFAQVTVIANDDSITVNGELGGFFSMQALNNDIYPAGYAITQLSTTHPSVYLANNNGSISVLRGTPAGTYYIQYKLCQINSTTNCDTATITVDVCNISPPVIQNITQPTCNNSRGSVTLEGLPTTGSWTITQYKYYNITTEITGSGTNYTINDLEPGNYTFKVKNSTGCSSTTTVPAQINYINGISGTMTGRYIDYNNDGITNVGDRISYQFSITNQLNCPINNIEIGQGSGAITISGSPIASIPAGATNTSVTAIHLLTQSDINAGFVSAWASATGTTPGGSSLYIKLFTDFTLNIARGIKLNPFIDTNNNGIQEISEANFTQGNFNYRINNADPVHYLYTSNGVPIIYETNPANRYDINYGIYNSCAGEYSLPISSYNNVTVPANSGITTYNFPIRAFPCEDLKISISGSQLRPNTIYYNYLYFGNNGNQNASGTVTFTKDPHLTIINMNEYGLTPTSTGFTYQFTDLPPGSHISMRIKMQVPNLPAVTLGSQLTTSASITISQNDSDPANNVSSLTQTITGSYDPNDKMESHGNKILFSQFTQNDYLTYTIRFENTGNGNAQDIKVTDILDSRLDENLLKMITSSHAYALERTTNNLTWKFDGINLPPSSTNPETGKGYILFQVKPKSNYAVGDIIQNTAKIYFDSNPAIITNTTQTEFVATLSAEEFENNNLSFYPNPVKDKLNLNLNDSGSIKSFTVSDITGKQILTKNTSSANIEIDFSRFSKGIYFVKVTSVKSQKTIKIIKE